MGIGGGGGVRWDGDQVLRIREIEGSFLIDLCGLTWPAVCMSLFTIGLDLTEDEAALEIIYDTIYTDFVEEIDASSNGMFAIYDNCDSS